ncbi:hypothetical protein FNZ56_06830 [Pseudoluteimonas lycopersici]|uniref:DUF4124 domain-containing protein n=1 Tax=Pseudoluteimonas lycopersici TaxID=1324796 RepID=A0A516V526_9GAMM|nr:hypothetical protein [Lysobacter lycopersici]QDQ73607.1 hypothetical protein FNZ56_06830 [Lysobacter lycopersici]
MRSPRPAFLTGLLLPACAVALSTAIPATRAHAEVHRCTAPNGESIYTDKSCSAIGAIDRRPQSVAGLAGASRLYRSSCSRTLQDLVYELTSAIDNRDVNRLAGVYDWNGMSSSSAFRVMDRLDAIAQRPLVDVLPVMPRVPDEDGTLVDGEYYPQDAVRRAPVGLRLEQTIGTSAAPSRTVLGLRKYMDCWWVRL